MPASTKAKSPRATYSKARLRELNRLCESSEVCDSIVSHISYDEFDKIWDKHCKKFGENEELAFVRTEFALPDGAKFVIVSNAYRPEDVKIRFDKKGSN